MRTRYVGKEWWRRVRLPIIEQRAASEIARYEAKIARIGTSWIPVDMLVEKLWGYSLLYADPVEYGAASGALAALRPDLRMVIVSDRKEHKKRVDWNAAHEGAHIVLHVPPVNMDPTQGSFPFGDEVERKRFLTKGGTSVPFAGNIVPREHEPLVLHGKFVKHPKYGQQFEVANMEFDQHLDADGLANYLANNPDIKGIGPAKARVIADRFGGDFERVLIDTPEQISEVAKLPLPVIEDLRNRWLETALIFSMALLAIFQGFEPEEGGDAECVDS